MRSSAARRANNVPQESHCMHTKMTSLNSRPLHASLVLQAASIYAYCIWSEQLQCLRITGELEPFSHHAFFLQGHRLDTSHTVGGLDGILIQEALPMKG